MENRNLKKTNQGLGFDLSIVKRRILEHGSLRKCLRDDEIAPIVVRYPRWVIDVLRLSLPPFSGPRRIVVYWGPTGVGKTRRVFEECPNVENMAYDCPVFDYKGGEHVLFDMFDRSCIPLRHALHLFDRYPTHIRVIGAYAPWHATTIYLTATTHPKTWYPGQDYAPLERRLTEIIELKRE